MLFRGVLLEFCQAYTVHFLVALFNAKGLRPHLEALSIPHLDRVLSCSDLGTEPVWQLRQLVAVNDVSPASSIIVADYGFMNCRTQEQRTDLKTLYKQTFVKADADPVKLHEACNEGKIFEYLNSLLRFNKEQKQFFRPLLTNLYTMPDNS